MTPGTQDELGEMRDGISQDVPLLETILTDETPLAEYCEALFHPPKSPVPRDRQEAFKVATCACLLESFTDSELKDANLQWDGDWVLNIFDHHLPLNHPFMHSANLLAQLRQLPSESPNGILVLSDAGVPYNNVAFNRGFMLHDQLLRVVSDRHKRDGVYHAPRLDSFPLRARASQKEMTAEDGAFLDRIESILEEAGGGAGAMEQISRINYRLWPLLFEEKLRPGIPPLLYVANELVCANLLIDYLKDPDHLFSRMLLDPALRSRTLELFDGLTGCWNQDGSHGTTFFWRSPGGHHFSRLRLDGDYLVDTEADYRLHLDAEAIQSALREREIYPGMFLVYGISVFFCGIVPLVGFGSLNYLPRMRDAWETLLRDIDAAEAERIAEIDIGRTIGGPLLTWDVSGKDPELLYALDIIRRGGLTSDYLDRLRQFPFHHALAPALPDIYNVYVHPEHRREIKATSVDMMRLYADWLK